MLDDDDLSGLYDPDEFGTRAMLRKDNESKPINGLIIDQKDGNKLKRNATERGGVRINAVGLVLQIPASKLPDDWQNWSIELSDGHHTVQNYNIVDASTPQSGSCDLVLTPYKPRTAKHGEWLRN